MTNIVANHIDNGRTIGRVLRLIRQERNLTLADVETVTGINYVVLSHLERGNRDMKSLDKVCKLLAAYGWEMQLKPVKEVEHE